MPNKSVFAAGAADSDPGTSLGTGTGTGTTTSGQNSTSISDAIAAGVTREDIEAAIKTATGKSDEEVRKIYNAATNDTTKIVINSTKLYTGGITNVSADVKFTDEACAKLVKVPRVFLSTVLKGYVAWAKENNVTLITEKEMEIIQDKRNKEKK